MCMRRPLAWTKRGMTRRCHVRCRAARHALAANRAEARQPAGQSSWHAAIQMSECARTRAPSLSTDVGRRTQGTRATLPRRGVARWAIAARSGQVPANPSEMVAVTCGASAELYPGDVIDGRYRILRKLADGGMGTVFLATHMLIRRRVAIKLLHPELAPDPWMVRRFLNEAAAAGTLGHPHIVESTDMGFTRDGIPYIVFEY